VRRFVAVAVDVGFHDVDLSSLTSTTSNARQGMTDRYARSGRCEECLGSSPTPMEPFSDPAAVRHDHEQAYDDGSQDHRIIGHADVKETTPARVTP
jgi:hypothetical protein